MMHKNIDFMAAGFQNSFRCFHFVAPQIKYIRRTDRQIIRKTSNDFAKIFANFACLLNR